jgi:hypothetical protein
MEIIEHLYNASWQLSIAILIALIMLITMGIGLSSIFKHNPLGRAVLFTVFAVMATAIYGKKVVSSAFYFESGLKDNGSYTTNDTVVIKWLKDGKVPIPDNTTVYFDYRKNNSTNANEWIALGYASVADYQATFTLLNATNYNFSIYYDYIPPAPVNTNGVWKYETNGGVRNTQGEEHTIAPVGSRIEGDAKPITPLMQGEHK